MNHGCMYMLLIAQGGLSLNAWVDREGMDRTTVKILVRYM